MLGSAPRLGTTQHGGGGVEAGEGGREGGGDLDSRGGDDMDTTLLSFLETVLSPDRGSKLPICPN